MKKLGVLISGSGTNLQAIIDNIETGFIPAEISVVISNNPDAYGLKRAQKKNIPTEVINHRDFSSREEFEKKLIEILNDFNVDYVILAGFMRVLTKYFINNFKNRILNIHPALLPSFPGVDAQKQAFDYGVKFSGCTVHFVTEEVDVGPIIIQAVVPVLQEDTAEKLQKRILEKEHIIFPLAIKMLVEEKLKIVGNKVEWEIPVENIKDMYLINPFVNF